jgi:hypothetical protein
MSREGIGGMSQPLAIVFLMLTRTSMMSGPNCGTFERLKPNRINPDN